jgi:hypothetical protein
MLIPIKKVVVTYHSIKFHDRREFTKPNINALVGKWIPCNLLWTPRFLGSEYVMRLRGNEEYCPEKHLIKRIMVYNDYSGSI